MLSKRAAMTQQKPRPKSFWHQCLRKAKDILLPVNLCLFWLTNHLTKIKIQLKKKKNWQLTYSTHCNLLDKMSLWGTHYPKLCWIFIVPIPVCGRAVLASSAVSLCVSVCIWVSLSKMRHLFKHSRRFGRTMNPSEWCVARHLLIYTVTKPSVPH